MQTPFVSYGGHSLTAVQLCSLVNAAFNRRRRWDTGRSSGPIPTKEFVPSCFFLQGPDNLIRMGDESI